MKQQFNIGSCGYYNRHWKGVFYPDKLPQRKWLNYYCEHFNTIELNSTFYKFPTPESLQVWFKKTPDDFIFSVKAPKLITHFKRFNDCKRVLNDFYTACEKGLTDKLACTLFQLPPTFQYSEEKLELIIKGLYPGFKNVVEFRHKSWWTKKVYDELTASKIVFCSVSHPKLAETIIANTRTAYVRLHGKEKMFYSDYSTDALIKLHQSIEKKKKIKEAFVYFNNTASTAGILNAQQFKQIALSP